MWSANSRLRAAQATSTVRPSDTARHAASHSVASASGTPAPAATPAATPASSSRFRCVYGSDGSSPDPCLTPCQKSYTKGSVDGIVERPPDSGVAERDCVTRCGCIQNICDDVHLHQVVCPEARDPEANRYSIDDLGMLSCAFQTDTQPVSGCRPRPPARRMVRTRWGDVVREATCESHPAENTGVDADGDGALDLDFSSVSGFAVCQRVISPSPAVTSPAEAVLVDACHALHGELRTATLDQMRVAVFTGPSDVMVGDAVCRAAFFPGPPRCALDSILLCESARTSASPPPSGGSPPVLGSPATSPPPSLSPPMSPGLFQSPPSGRLGGLRTTILESLRDSRCLLPTEREVRFLLCQAPAEIPYVPQTESGIVVCRGRSYVRSDATQPGGVSRIRPAEFLCSTLGEQSIGPEVFDDVCMYPGGAFGGRPFRDGDAVPEVLCCCHGSISVSRSDSVSHKAVISVANAGKNLEDDRGQAPTARASVDCTVSPPVMRFCGLVSPNVQPVGEARAVRFTMLAHCPLTGLVRPFILCAREDRRTWYVTPLAGDGASPTDTAADDPTALAIANAGDDALTAESTAFGLSWDRPNNNLRRVLAELAQPGDRVWLLRGTYVVPTPTANELLQSGFARPDTDTLVVPPGVTVYGGFAGNESELCQRNSVQNATIITGRVQDVYSRHAIRFAESIDQPNDLPSGVDGVRFLECHAPVNDPDFVDAAQGGAIYVESARANVEIRNCAFDHCTAVRDGGAIYSDGAENLVIENCHFGFGVLAGEPPATQCGLTVGNGRCAVGLRSDKKVVAGQRGGAIAVLGTDVASVRVRRCIFLGAVAYDRGGAISLQDVPRAEIAFCTFRYQWAGRVGAAIHYDETQGTGGRELYLRSCYFALNETRVLFPADASSPASPSSGGPTVFTDCPVLAPGSPGGSPPDAVGPVLHNPDARIILPTGVDFPPALGYIPFDTVSGGGVLAATNDRPGGSLAFTASNCVFATNADTVQPACVTDQVSGGGGALLVHGRSVGEIKCCTFYTNVTSGLGGAIRAQPSPVTDSQPLVRISNTIFWRNGTVNPVLRSQSPSELLTPHNPVVETSAPTNTLSPNAFQVPTSLFDVVNVLTHPLTGDVNVEPKFQLDPIDPALVEPDLHLLRQSVAVDRGTNDPNLLRVLFDGRFYPLTRDLDGNMRRTQGLADRAGGSPTVDFGAYEYCLPATLDAFPHAVATSDVTLDGQTNEVISRETNWGNLVADAIWWAANFSPLGTTGAPAQMAFISAGEVDIGRDIVPGAIPMAELATVFAFEHRVVVMDLTVAKLKEVFEAGFSAVNQGKVFLQVSNVVVDYNLTRDPIITDQARPCASILPGRAGDRVRRMALKKSVPFRDPTVTSPAQDAEDVLIDNGVVLDPTRIIRVATTDFVADNAFTLCPDNDPRETLCFAYGMAVRDYLQKPLGGQVTQPNGYRQQVVTLNDARLIQVAT